MIKKIGIGLFLVLLFVASAVLIYFSKKQAVNMTPLSFKQPMHGTAQTDTNPLMISEMRKKSYPGSDITIEQELPAHANYRQYIASYKSEGLKIYALLTVPSGNKPKNGWPAILFNHGYIPPTVYRTTERYVAYVDAFARNNYIVFKPDYRGNGNSEGQPEGAYYSPAYATDDLNALSSIKRYKDANPQKIGIWGHSMGGNITLRDMVVNAMDIKAVVIWGGVVGSYNDLMNNWQRNVKYQPPPTEMVLRNNYRSQLIQRYGTPTSNPAVWNAMDPTYFLSSITTPVQLHHGLSDEEVPPTFSKKLASSLEKIGKTVEYYTYPGADHNISNPNFEVAMERSLAFFHKFLQ